MKMMKRVLCIVLLCAVMATALPMEVFASAAVDENGGGLLEREDAGVTIEVVEEHTCDYEVSIQQGYPCHGYETKYVCSICGDYYWSYDQPIAEHAFYETMRDGEVCSGYIVEYSCAVCGDYCWEFENPSADHNYRRTDAEGYSCSGHEIEYTCTVCNDYYWEYSEPIEEHDFYVSNVWGSDCTGYEIEYTCAVCGENGWESTGATTDHLYREFVEGTICTGYDNEYVCELCGDSYWEYEPPSTDHDYETHLRVDSYGCLYAEHVCTLCGEEESEELGYPAAGGLEEEGFIYSAYDDPGVVVITGYTGTPVRVVIPEELGGCRVAAIAEEAFEYCETLTELVLSEGVESIGAYAFYGCTGLETVEFPDSLVRIDSGAFADCSKLETINYPVNWSVAGMYIFEGCDSLNSVVIPEGVTGIPDFAFCDATGLETVQFPEELEVIGAGAFSGTALTAVKLPDRVREIGEEAFCECEELRQLELSASIHTISDGVFSGCSSLVKLVIPEGVERIEGYAFEWCTALESVKLPDTLTHISDYAFENCTGLKSVNYPVNLCEAGNGIFANCGMLTEIEIPSGVSYIPDYLFSGAAALETVIIPEGVESIGSYAFSGTALSEVVLPDSVVFIYDGAFQNCSDLKEVHLNKGLKVISGGAFSNCVQLESVVFPESVMEIHDYAFENCIRLADVGYPKNLVYAGKGVFSGCTKLRGVSVPAGVTVIYDNFFEGASSLQTVVLPEGLEYIGSYAFANSGITSIVLPSSVTTVSDGAFYGCKLLKTAALNEGLRYIGWEAFADCSDLEAVEIPDTVIIIEGYAFRDCVNLEEFNYPVRLTKAGGGIFSGCVKLNEMRVPDGVTAIPDYLFEEADYLETVVLPDGLESIGVCAFADSGLISVTLPDSVTAIGDHAFSGCDWLESLALNEGLISIGWSAFSDCTDLERVDFPESLTTIEGYAFAGCSSLRSIGYPVNWNYSGAAVFSDCTKLTSVVVPEGVSKIPDRAFSDAGRLRHVSLPNTLKIIGDGAFDSTGLTEVVFPSGVTLLGADAFAYCEELTKVVLNEGLRSVGWNSFGGCGKLAYVSVPGTLTEIGDYAFCDCVGLQKIIIPNSVTDIGGCAFENVPELVIYCNMNSATAAYAIDRNIPIVDLKSAAPTDKTVLDWDQSSYRMNYDGASASGYLTMAVSYALGENGRGYDTALILNIPACTELIEETLVLNGALCTDYSYDAEQHVLTVPVDTMSGVLRFSVEPTQYGKIASYAKIHLDDGVNQITEIIGTVYTELSMLTLSEIGTISGSEFTVSGVSIPGNSIVLYIDGEEQTTVTANKAGDFSAELALENVSNGKEYTVLAKTYDADGERLTAAQPVTYRKGAPTLTMLTMEHAQQVFRLDRNEELRPVVNFVPGESFRFVIQFDLPENVKSVYVVSTRNNMRKSMEAFWDKNQQAFVADGFFDPDDLSYVPGTITLEYERDGGKKAFSDEFDFAAEEILNAIPDAWKDASVIVHEDSEDAGAFTIEAADRNSSFNVSAGRNKIPAGLTAGNAEAYGYIKVGDDAGNTVFVKQTQTQDSMEMEVLDFLAGEAVNYVIDEVVLDGIPACGVANMYADIFEGAVNDIRYEVMRGEIQNSTKYSAAEKKTLLRELEEAQSVNQMVTILQTAAAIAGIAGLIPGGQLVAFGVNVGCFLLGMYRDYRMTRMEKLMKGYRFGWAIDPSGYVYNTETGERIAGAVVTVYWIPFDEEAPDYWAEVPDAGEYGVDWDAAEYSQLNPLTTDAEGRYAWDVPEGWWRVKCELDGYETTWSDWVPVPPPQTEVNIGMVPVSVSVLYGDVSGDGKVTVTDLAMLRKYLANKDPITGESTVEVDAGADANGDGRITTLDLAMLRKYLANKDPFTGESTFPLGPKN